MGRLPYDSQVDKKALKDLEEIESYIAQDDLEHAYTFIGELLDFGDKLGDFPEKGTQAKWTGDCSKKEMYYEQHTFIYETSTNGVIIHEVHNFAKMVRHFII